MNSRILETTEMESRVMMVYSVGVNRRERERFRGLVKKKCQRVEAKELLPHQPPPPPNRVASRRDHGGGQVQLSRATSKGVGLDQTVGGGGQGRPLCI